MGVLTWGWISRRMEEQVLAKALTHTNKIIETMKYVNEVMAAFKRGVVSEVESNFKKVHTAEKEADEIKREAIKELSEGYVHPIDREELIRLILTTDDIAAFGKSAARKATMISPDDIDAEIKDYLVVISSKIAEATALIRQALEAVSKEPRKALEIADNIERIEEEVDDIRAEAIVKILKFCEKSKISSCIIAKEIIDSLEQSTDKCEDVADVIRSIAVMRT